jgi:uncharacterized protein (DUF362 family)
MPSHALVALIRTAPATALEDFERLIDLARFRDQFDPGLGAILRPSVRRHFPFPGANTTPWQLEGVVHALRAAGCYDLIWSPPRPGIASAFAGEDLHGYLPILRANSVALVCRAGGPARHGASLVLLPTLKTDAATAIGGALWCLLDDRAPPCRDGTRHMHEQLVDALAASREQYSGIFAVMDGTTIGIGAGPYFLQPEIRGVLLASADPLALDAVAAQLMGLDPLRDVAYLRLAHEHGLGVADPRAIELVGDVELARERWVFAASGARLPYERRILGVLGPILERSRWSFAERPVFESWLYGTPWGRLFARYQRLGYGEQRKP